MTAPDDILRLIDQFQSQLASYRSQEYNEAQVRNEFIEPFFASLGWDVYNKQGNAYAYKDVIYEDSIKVAGATKAPDYAFRIGGTRKFFVEAKKPSISIRDEITPAYQLRRYAWSAHLPLSILTDFEEFAIYDCRPKPDKSDKASTGRIKFLNFMDYPSHWDEIYSVFSPQAILKGSFDQFAEAAAGKRGTAEVDDAFLAEIERWRDLLAHNIALRNPTLSQRDLNYAVQMTIDRLIFLRICEDRGIEFYGQLQSLFNGGETYARLYQLFRKADERYNSGLFHFHSERDQADSPDMLTPGLLLDDKPLKDILTNLYYPDSPYEFSVLPADILGQVYERFLGKVIRLTSGHRAVVEDKPEVKKAGGVFYTPTFIVDYIVKNTLGKLLEDKAPGQFGVGRGTPLRVLDMSCGSGSFLIGAYQYLMDWYLAGYTLEPEKWSKGAAPRLYQTSSSDGIQWKLTTSERKRILLDHIYGVDIDSQAVEVTKLSLLLKVLEGESEETIGKQLSMFRERVLPDLAFNIKCGNSLIGSDFYASQSSKQGMLPGFNLEEQYRINAFDWHWEFAGVFSSSGGFDVIIGNPPYIRSQSLGALQREYYKQKYATATATYDIYVLFVENAISIQSKGGRCGFILPNKFFTTDYGEGLRKLLTENKNLNSLVDFEDAQIFEGAGTYTTLLFISQITTEFPQYARLGYAYREKGRTGLSQTLLSGDFHFSPIDLSRDGSRWTMAAGVSGQLLIRLQHSFLTLKTLNPHIFQGLKTSADKVYILKVKNTVGNKCVVCNGFGDDAIVETELLKPMVKGEHVQRYYTTIESKLFVLYPYRLNIDGNAVLIKEIDLRTHYPDIWAYLQKYRSLLGARDNGKWKNRSDWYAYARSQNISTFLGQKFLVPYMTTRLRLNLDSEGELFLVNITTGGYGLRIHDGYHAQEYFLGLLNSALMNYCARQMTNQFRGGYFAVNKQMLERLPIRTINFSDPVDVKRHDQMVTLVKSMLSLYNQLASSNTPTEKTLIQRQIDITDGQIDSLVYELYSLTDQEIGIL